VVAKWVLQDDYIYKLINGQVDYFIVEVGHFIGN